MKHSILIKQDPIFNALWIFLIYTITTLVLEFLFIQYILNNSYFEAGIVFFWFILVFVRAPINTLYIYAMYKLNVCRRIISPLWVAAESVVILGLFGLVAYLVNYNIYRHVPLIAVYLFPYVIMTIGLVIAKKLVMKWKLHKIKNTK